METLYAIKCSVLHNWIKTVIRMRGDHEYFPHKLCSFDTEWPSNMWHEEWVLLDIQMFGWQTFKNWYITLLK